MTSHAFIKIKRPVKPTPKPQRPTQDTAPVEVEPTQPLQIEQPKEPASTGQLESLPETALDESMFACGWSLTELLNEFNSR